MIQLQNAEEFIKVTEGDIWHYGGNQAWFAWKDRKSRSDVARKGACGTVVLANITAYLAKSSPACAGLYSYPDFTKESFLSHMKDLYEYVSPWHIGKIPLGIWPVCRLAVGMERFARDKGIRLKAVWREWSFSRGNVLCYLKEGLEKNLPVAMLIGSHRLEKIQVFYPGRDSYGEDIQFHWVTVTGVEINERQNQVRIKVSTWGGWAWLDLDEYMKERFYAGVVYFELDKGTFPC